MHWMYEHTQFVLCTHAPTQAIQHLIPLHTDLCERLDAPKMASSRDSSNHACFSVRLSQRPSRDCRAAIGPSPAAVELAGRIWSNSASPRTAVGSFCLGRDLRNKSSHTYNTQILMKHVRMNHSPRAYSRKTLQPPHRFEFIRGDTLGATPATRMVSIFEVRQFCDFIIHQERSQTCLTLGTCSYNNTAPT